LEDALLLLLLPISWNFACFLAAQYLVDVIRQSQKKIYQILCSYTRLSRDFVVEQIGCRKANFITDKFDQF
jgi:hypothetical protein